MSELLALIRSDEAKLGDYMTLFIRLAVWFVVTLLWIVIGFFFWVPFLIRIVVYYTGSVLISAFTGADLQEAEESLEMAISFYTMGFYKVNRLVVKQDLYSRGYKQLRRRDYMYVAGNLLFTFTFWGAVLVLFAEPEGGIVGLVAGLLEAALASLLHGGVL